MNQLVYHLSLGALLGSLLAAAPALAQGVGIGTTTPNAAAALDIAATATGKGLLIPRLDSATRVAIPSPPTGLLVFQVGSASPRTRTGFYYYGGGSWLYLPDKASSGDNLGNGMANTAVNLQANALVGTGASIGSTVGVGVRADGGLNLGQNTSSSISLGYLSGAATTGSGNSFFGVRSGQYNTTGSSNTFSGAYSGNGNDSGSNNTFTGAGSGSLNNSGSFNVYTGSGSGQTSTGSSNTFQGYFSGQGARTGSGNTFIGRSSGDVISPGNSNTYVGAYSGTGVSDNNTVTAIGYQSGSGGVNNLTNATALGANVSLAQSNTVILGNNANVGIGTDSPTAKLDVVGSARLRGLTTAGFVATDANGNLSSTATVPGDNLGNHSATQALALNNNKLLLQTATDTYHALQYSSTYDGPLLYGYSGGALGYTSNGSAVTPVLRWTRTNNVAVGLAGTNAGAGPDLSFGGAGFGEGIGSARATGSLNLNGLDFYTAGIKRLTIGNGGTVSVGVAGTNSGTAPDLVFGGSGTGEGIGSARSSGNPNQYGLDFYTGFTKRLSLTNTGSVGIGTTAPSSTLQVNGSLAVGVARNVAGGPASNPVPLGSQGYYGLLPTNSNGSQDVYQLPAPGAVPGRLYYLRNLSTTNTAYLTTPSGTDIFDGGSNIPSTPSNFYTMSPSGGSKSVTAISDGVIWTILRSDN
jgi:hypothetical protein